MIVLSSGAAGAAGAADKNVTDGASLAGRRVSGPRSVSPRPFGHTNLPLAPTPARLAS